MGTQKNATYKVHNGTDFDEINFKTMASQVKMASGVDLESGFLNSKNDSGYTKLPNGLIMQWGGAILSEMAPGSATASTVTLPVTFTSKVFACNCTVWRNASLGGTSSVHIVNSTSVPVGLNSITVMVSDNAAKLDRGTSFQVFWEIIGY